jgi:hypothetical protein
MLACFLRFLRCVGPYTSYFRARERQGGSADPYSANGSRGDEIEERVQKLAGELSDVIRAADDDRRGELRRLALALLYDEESTSAAPAQQVESAPRSYAFNPLPLGIILIILSIGFFVFVPLLSLILAFIGTVLGMWGGVMIWRGK